VIVRTVGEELNRTTFEKEFQRLHEVWETIQKKAATAEPPALVHSDAKLVSGVIRDLFSDKFDSLTVDDRDIHAEISRYLRAVDPDLLGRLQLYSGSLPLFDHAGIEEEIHHVFQKKVELPSGGYIVIEPTEALVSIDVNTGRFTGKKKKDPEHTILKTNLDAAREIARQLRLRDVGGIVVCDFIDMESQKDRDRVLHELRSHLGRDRARTKAFEVSELGLVEMTRQRVRPSLFDSLTEVCTHCGGAGRVFSPATVVRRVERSLNRVGAEGKEKRIVVRLHPEVALQILEQEAEFLPSVRRRTRIKVDLLDDPLMRQDEFRLLAGPAETDVTERYVKG
jgi:ribonuclease G